MVANTPTTCDLCGLPLPAKPVRLEIDGQEKLFCCQGCARVYETAHDQDMLSAVLPPASTPKKRDKAKNPLKKIPEPVLAGQLPASSQKKETTYFSINGMWCAGCSVAAERVLKHQPGVQEVDVSFSTERGRMVYDPSLVDPDKLLKGLSPLGYQAHQTFTPEIQREVHHTEMRVIQLLAAIGFGMQVMILYLVQLYPLYARGEFNSTTVRREEYVVWLAASVVLFFGGQTFITGAWRSIVARSPGMDTLIALGTLSAYSYSVYVTLTGRGETYFDSVTMITVFVLFGRVMELMGGSRARKDLQALLKLQPDEAWRKTNGTWQTVKASELASGDTILIKPGERVPADAQVIEGEAAINEALLTGESLPVTRGEGQKVFAGSTVNEGAITCKVTSPPGSTRLAQITRMVSDTLSSKPPIQRLADQASVYFTYAILLAAVLAFAGHLYLGSSPSHALLRAVAVLVVACPCALGLATPLALSVTLGSAVRRGIYVRNPTALETTPKIRRLVVDKTGTLTLGKPSVDIIIVKPDSKFNESELLRLAASVEQFSEHPLAKAIRAAGDAAPYPAKEFIPLRGMGASARVQSPDGWHYVIIGSEKLAGDDADLKEEADGLARLGSTIVWVTVDSKTAGLLELRDALNPTAREAVSLLQKEGIEVTLLSGDSLAATRQIAHEVGILDFDGGCMPEDKAERIRQWQQEGYTVGMVGDGVNDAPALAQADLSITAAGGTDIAGQASDLILTHPSLTLVPWFFELSKKTRRTIMINLVWAFAYNLIAVPLAVVGIISPVLAAATMSASSLLVVFNSLRLNQSERDEDRNWEYM